jgi:transposase
MKTIHQIAAWRSRQEPLGPATARTEAIRLAQRIRQTYTEIAQNDKQLSHLVAQSHAAGLTSETGIGPVTAATVLAAWAYPGRLRNEAAFAALAGASPLPASSGNTVRYRLNRGGDRQLNRALNVIAMHRTIHDPETQAYVDKRRAQGKTDREIRQCLKRYLARRIYRHLNQAANSAQRC